MAYETLHATHPDIVKRLRRAEGHLRSIVEMIEAGCSCLDLAQQLHAVEKAIANAKRTLIHDHIDHCLANAIIHVDPMHASGEEHHRIAEHVHGNLPAHAHP
jgi:hypothetical protein NreA